MGGFATIAGLAGVEASQIRVALREYARKKGGRFSRDRRCIFPGALVITPGEPKRVSILYPADLNDWVACEELVSFLSKHLYGPTFLFHSHDGDLWLYEFFVKGAVVDRFNPAPEYWDDNLTAKEKKRWAGNARLVARLWPDLRAAAISRYLKFWDPKRDRGKAYPDDAYSYDDCRQLSDFMRRLGLRSPLDENDELVGDKYLLELPST